MAYKRRGNKGKKRNYGSKRKKGRRIPKYGTSRGGIRL